MINGLLFVIMVILPRLVVFYLLYTLIKKFKRYKDMKRKYKTYIFALIVSCLLAYFGNIIGASISSSENIGNDEIQTMLKSRFNLVKVVQVESKGEKYSIPLPSAAAKFSNKTYNAENQYLVPVGGNMTMYLDVILPLYGWEKYDREGAAYFLKHKDNKERMEIIVNNFTIFYSRMYIRVYK